MKTASIKLKLDKFGSTVPKNDVTPAEVMVLTALHNNNAGGSPIVDLRENGEIERDRHLEVNRLTNLYGRKVIRVAFPGNIPTLPDSFEEAMKIGLTIQAPTNRLLTAGDTQGLA